MIPIVDLHIQHGMMDQMVNVIPRVLIIAVPNQDIVELLTSIANVKAASIFESQIKVIVIYITFTSILVFSMSISIFKI